jgi:hypothetical protein
LDTKVRPFLFNRSRLEEMFSSWSCNVQLWQVGENWVQSTEHSLQKYLKSCPYCTANQLLAGWVSICLNFLLSHNSEHHDHSSKCTTCSREEVSKLNGVQAYWKLVKTVQCSVDPIPFITTMMHVADSTNI